MGREVKVMGRLEEAHRVSRVAGTSWVYGCFLDPNRTSPLWEGVCDRERVRRPDPVYEHVWVWRSGVHPLRAGRPR